MSRDLVVVSGSPRSGTSMMMRALQCGGIPAFTDGAHQPDEHNPNGYYEHARVARSRAEGLDWVGDARGMAVKVLFRGILLLPETLKADIIWMVRAPEAIRASWAAFNRGESYVSHGMESLRDETRIAMEKRPGCRVLVVDYDDVVNNPQEMMAHVAKFLGGKLDVRAMAAVPEQRYRHHQPQGGQDD